MFHDKGYNLAAEKAIIRKRFIDFQYCIAQNDIDIENDNLKFFATGNDGVCITSLHVDNRQIYVGKNDNLTSFEFARPNQGESFACHEDKLITSLLTINNGEVIQSQCKGITKK